jgi:hypothetical protein
MNDLYYLGLMSDAKQNTFILLQISRHKPAPVAPGLLREMRSPQVGKPRRRAVMRRRRVLAHTRTEASHMTNPEDRKERA